MNAFQYYKRISYLLELIQKDRASSPKDLSTKFNCSEKTIRNMIVVLRNEGYNIKFCKNRYKYILLDD
jgi:DeoR/GlpR family transcriptional regulator of sugar metabolism